MMDSGLVFVLSHIDVIGKLPLELVQDYSLRRARNGEVEIIKCILQRATYPAPGLRIAYDAQIREEKTANGCIYHREPLPRSRWKYWVMAFEGDNNKVREIEYAAQLIEHDLDFGFTLFFEKAGQSGKCDGFTNIPIHLVEKYTSSDEVNANAIQVTTSELGEIRAIYNSIKSLNQECTFIDHAIKNLYSLKAVSKRSDLRIVGYFSIVEALITHQPRLNESLDSITQQVKNKMILLKKRFRRKISEQDYFMNVSENKLWAKLYSYRSSIAHGGLADFTKTFEVLVSSNMVQNYMNEIVKELIILGLGDPVFLGDLRNC
jgi:hypothetical protein